MRENDFLCGHTGIGTELLVALQQYIAEHIPSGLAVSLELISTKEAVAFYKKNGFEERPCAWNLPRMFKTVQNESKKGEHGMKKSKNIVALIIGICLAVILSACAESSKKYESVEGFQRYYSQEEYRPQYAVVAEKYHLEANTEYRLQLDAECESGVIEILVTYGAEMEYKIDSVSPCHQVIEVPENAADEVIIHISASPDTKGKVLGELQRHL